MCFPNAPFVPDIWKRLPRFLKREGGSTMRDDDLLVGTMMTASLAAAAIHLAVAPAHFSEYLPAGIFMLVVGLFQLGWIIATRGAPSFEQVRLATAVNLAIVWVWIASRTIGLPFGPTPWMVEDVHTADAVATAAEMLVIWAGAAWARPGLPRPGRRMLALARLLALLATVSSSHDPTQERVLIAAALWLGVIVGAAQSRRPAFPPMEVHA